MITHSHIIQYSSLTASSKCFSLQICVKILFSFKAKIRVAETSTTALTGHNLSPWRNSVTDSRIVMTDLMNPFPVFLVVCNGLLTM